MNMVRLVEYKKIEEHFYEELQKVTNLNESSMLISFTVGEAVDEEIFFIDKYIPVDCEFAFDSAGCVFLLKYERDCFEYSLSWDDVSSLKLFNKKIEG